MKPSNRFNSITSTVLQTIVLLYQVLAVVVFIGSLLLAYSWLKNPFIGGFFEQTMIFNGSVTREPGATWALQETGVRFGDQLVSVAGHPIHNSNDLLSVLETFRVGQTVPVVMRQVDGNIREVSITLESLSAIDQLSYFVIPALLSLTFLLISLWVFGLRRTEPAGRAFSMLTTSMAIGIGALFDLYTSHSFTYVWTLAVAVSGGALIALALAFPQEARILFRVPYLLLAGYVVSIFLTLNAYRVLFDYSNPTAYIDAWGNIYIFAGLSGLLYFGILGYRAFFSLSPVVKSQARTILIGALLAFGPIVFWLLYTSIKEKGVAGNATPFNPYLFIFFIFFPLANGYVILRFRLLRTDDWLRRGMVYTLLTIFVISAYGLLVSGLSLVLSTRVASNNPVVIGILVFLIAVFLDPVRSRLQKAIDNIFFRGQRAYEERLRVFSHELTNALDLNTIGRVLREQISSSLVPEQFHVYAYDTLNDQYYALANGGGRPTSDIRFQSSSPLVQYFQKETIPLYLDTINPPTLMKGDEARLSLLGARLFVGLPGEDHPVGWLALGTPHSGSVYTPRDLNFLENLADQASVAIARVQTLADLERRMQEMNVMSRVSQGVNVTLTFDDVLELIYTQATQILPSTLFHITLYNKPANYFYYAFRVDDNERVTSRENQPLPATLGLGAEVIRKGRPILTQEYVRECQSRNLIPSAMGVYAWMGVPLNSGSETMGALSIGSRDQTVTYTKAQLDLLQAIADQTVGAIVKARLLEETQQRAHQLSTLNEITRQLTSTLEQEPLLRNILENAVNILNCEAGTLFLMDEQTGDLIFRVTTGPVAGNLLGQRLQAGAGVAGRAVQTRLPVIENDSQRSTSARFEGTDKQTGYTSRSLLAVPMLIKERVLGVIEVINRKDGLPFVEDDQNLLTAFAGQAAVAIENARLLALTDQELARSVEELQVMGRIVRELNASLDVDRAMRITLEYAMRHSNAEAGLIGMLEEDELRIMAQQGYEEMWNDQTITHLPLQYPAIQTVIQSGQASQVSLLGNGSRGIMASAHSQIIIPIRREAQVIGLILLESSSDSQGNLAFLNRLSDNAAIAISNAQLYAEVQRANLAKSEFVSFVAHELKNPMTSIKGYTELLAAGSVGPINEMQTNFLGTIRSNVERMSTLVSDLNDNAKIEAGRLRLDYRPVDVKEVVDEVLRSTKRQVEDKRQSVDLQLPPQLPEVWADRTRVAQVLINLISNAYKYTPEGGQILIGAEEADNQWDPEGAKRVAHLWVQDNGIGIGFEDQSRIFQRFFRSEDTRAREAPGTGLGLNITKSLVEMQGGRIWFNSEFRKGTTFHFTIPISEG